MGKKLFSYMLGIFLGIAVATFASTVASRQYNFVDDKAAGIPITASRVDAEFDNAITKLNQKAIIASSAPSSPIAGMFWYDSTNKLLKEYRNSEWIVHLPVHSGTANMTTNQEGDLWYNTTSNNYKYYDGGAWYPIMDGNTTQTINGIKTFGNFSITPSAAPTTDYQIANKKYVDDSYSVIQIVYNETHANATGTTLIPRDDTIPQVGEGDRYMTINITPTNATSILKIDVKAILGSSVSPDGMGLCIFQDGDLNATACVMEAMGAGVSTVMSLTHFMVAGTTSSTRFNVTAGGEDSGTTTFNGQGGARMYGGKLASSISVTEYKP